MSDSGDSVLLPTLPQTPRQPGPGTGITFDSLKGDMRFETGDLIARGGMGAVFNCTDVRLKRPMAVKHATSHSATDLERFVREARVQGQLEHPGIVPVHELGLDPDGLPYFTMKRVRGVTLADVIEQLRQGDTEAKKKHTRRRLLTALQSVCQAVEFAHSQSVLHRDLKPANVMLGDFGEVYVLDWGLAKPIGQHEHTPLEPAILHDTTIGATPTVAGSLLGTPGYMSPELVVGQEASVQSDVFALGSMLFELLTLERMVPGNSVMEILVATRDGFDSRIRVRAPQCDAPPELDAIVQKACARDAKDRYARVRELHDAIDRVLEGERDHELRAQMSKEHAARAQAELATMEGDSISDESRTRALQEANRALGLDAGNGEATAVLLKLLATPPRVMPADVKASLEKSYLGAYRRAMKLAAAGLLLVLLLVPHFFKMGAKNWVGLGALLAVIGVGSTASFLMSRMKRPEPWMAWLGMVAFMLTGAAVNIFWIPVVVASPIIVAAGVMYVSLLPRRFAVHVVVLGTLALMAPYITYWLGLMPAPIDVVDGNVIVHSNMLMLRADWTNYLIIDAIISTLVAGSYAARSLQNTLERAQIEIATRAWNLKQILPASSGLLEDTAADPKCAIQNFFENKRMPQAAQAARLAHATLHGR
jgi:eukaryotic-like serine/threonine-protein kinase